MRTRPLAAYALDKLRQWELQKSSFRTLTPRQKKILTEIDRSLATINEETIKAQIERNRIDIKNRSVVITAHPDLESTSANIESVEGLVKKSNQFQRLQGVAKAKGFINLVPVVQSSASGTHIVVKLHLKIPKKSR